VLQLWFVSRALGAVALLLLSLVLVLGILHNTSVVKNAELGLPRFVLVALHRNLSLISVVFIALHVATVIITDYVHLRVVDVFVPGIAPFNPVAAAFGTVATDLVLAIVLTSMLRSRLSRRVWFWVHWTSYLCWPISVVHAALNASFRGTTWWTLVVPLISLAAIIAALVYRRRDRRRVDVPVAERGKVTAEAIKMVTGEIPIPGRPVPAAADGEAETELLTVPAASALRGDHPRPGPRPAAGPSPRPRPTSARPPSPRPRSGPPGPGPAGARHHAPDAASPPPSGAANGRHQAGPDDEGGSPAVDAATEVMRPVEEAPPSSRH
jgi:methionine sulfoxide reductase heme-binding subunit